MSNKIEQISSRHWRVEGVTPRRDADPELRQKFANLFSNRNDIEQNAKNNAHSTGLLPSIVHQLSEVNRVVTWKNAEIFRQENRLTFRLLNGPMTGLTIVASWQAQVVTLQLKPKDQKQSEAINRIAPKFSKHLSQSKIPFQLEIMKYE
ncbi:hypothetical protein MHN79_11555 [Vibrio sp. Of14-4]|uniref:hypothetical protein n=1 Tax=Vibrio sp. Of14-4 TaxID=2724878 RepID=UPI001EF356A8|nr:hypothetical protein [Vibrio sp. Of14-4]MCG7490128.1 hypothetical protein [Vibrio sp. Of14-4]